MEQALTELIGYFTHEKGGKPSSCQTSTIRSRKHHGKEQQHPAPSALPRTANPDGQDRAH